MFKNFKTITSKEWNKVIPSFLFIFFLMIAYYIAKPVREGLSLEVGIKSLPYMTLFVISTTILFNFLYDHIVKKFDRRKLVITIFSILIVVFSIFAVVFKVIPELTPNTPNAIHTNRGMLIVTYVVWVSVFIPFCVAMLWSFVNDIFTSSQGKRLFGIIGAGGPVGALVGSILTSHIVKKIGVGNLLYISSFFIFLALLSMLRADRVDKNEKLESTDVIDNPGEENIGNESNKEKTNGFSLIFKNNYLLLISSMVILYTISSNIFYNNYARAIKENISGTASITAHYAMFYNYLNIIGAFIQFFVTGWLLVSVGLLAGLLALPIFDTVNLLFFSTGASFSILTWGMILSMASSYSIYNASKEVLYTPTPRSFKYQAKGIIDTLCFRIGSGIGAIFLILKDNYNFSMSYLFIVLGLILILRFIVAYILSHKFKEYESENGKSTS